MATTPAPDERLDRELRDHIERQVTDYVRGGVSEAEARRRARLEFGGLDQTKEACRDVRPFQWLDELARDVRLGFRALARERMFALSVTVILALGIGTSVTMFSVLNAVVLRPLPYTRPSELVLLTTHLMKENRPDGTSGANLLDWRAQSRSLAGLTFYRRTIVSMVTFTANDEPQRVQEGLVGGEFFDLLGATPLLGRGFSQDEFDRREPVVVLSEGLWQEQFLGSRDALGRTMDIDGRHHTVIGVMPAAFQLPTRETRFWRPLSLLPYWQGASRARGGDGFEVIGRLAPEVGIDQAQTEMSLLARRLRDAYPSTNDNLDVRVAPLLERVVGARTRRGVWLAFAAVLSLLAIACANVGGLLSVRTARRRRELAVRAALGAGHGRLIRQLLAESVSVWAIASAAGVLIAYGLIRLVSAYGPALPRIEQMTLDLSSLAAAFLGGLVVVAACGTIPALVAARTDAAAAFATRDQSGLPRHRVQDVLVAGQIAGTLVLLVGAVLFAQSFLRARGEDPGYPAEHLLIVRLDLPRSGYPDAAAAARFFREARERIGALPGVAAVGAMTDFFIRRNADQRVTVEGSAADREARLPRLAIEGVTPGFFRAVGIDLIEGREFEDQDLEPGAAPVVIVGEAVARRYWPGESAVGKHLVSGTSPPKDGRWSTVVGVARDIRREGLDVAPIQSVFVPSYLRGMDMTIRAFTGVDPLIPAVRREIRAIDRGLPITYVATVKGRLSERLGGRWFETQVLGVFAAIALFLSAAGVYALLAYRVTLRTREIGIRSALGADRRSIMTMVLIQGARLAVAGAFAGLLASVATARVLQSLLYQTTAIDAPSYAAALAFVLVVAALAASLPALRAARVSPMTALRED